MAGERLVRSGSERRTWRDVVRVTVLWLALVLTVTPAAIAQTTSTAAPKDMLQLSMEPVHQRVVDAAWRAGAQVAELYQRSPILVIGLAIAGALPLLAGIVALGRALRRRRETAVTRPAAPVSEGVRIGDKAWIEFARESDGASPAPVIFAGEMLRLGRHSDNDIALDHASVHRHHALIQRTPDQEFVLVDLTAGTGNVLLLNDRSVDRAALRDGDRITLGEAVVTFHIGADTPAGIVAPSTSRSTTRRTPMESRNVERDASDEPTGRAADRVETRRLDAADRVAARRADRSRA